MNISKENKLIGKGKIILNQKQLISKECSINKWINLDVLDSKKGKSLNSIMKINVKISLTYNNFSEEPSSCSNSKNAQTASKQFLHNKNHSGNLNPPMIGTSVRTTQTSSVKNDILQNFKMGLTPKSKCNKPLGNILTLNEKFKSCANNVRNVQLNAKGNNKLKAQNFASTALGNRSLHVGFKYNISYSGFDM
jgi:hypothetical protein